MGRLALGTALVLVLAAFTSASAVSRAQTPDSSSRVRERISELRQRVARDPADAEARRMLGVGLRKSGQIDEALIHLLKAVDLAPESPSPLFSLALAYSGEGRIDEAEATYRRLIELAPDHAQALNNLGNIAIRRGDEKGAIEWYARAVAARPDYLMARHRLAGLLQLYGRYDEAHVAHSAVMGMKPANPGEQWAVLDSQYQLAVIELARDRADEAERLLAVVVAELPAHPAAHYARAQALIRLGRQAEADRELEIHMEIKKNTPQDGPVATSR